MSVKRTKRIFISDTHLGLAKKWSWFPYYSDGKRVKTYVDNLAKFFDYVADRQDVKDLVLLGDIIDDWVWPAEQAPPSLGEILGDKCNKPIIDALTRVKEKGIKVLYVEGNHDMGVNEKLLEQYLPGVLFAGRAYTSRPVYAEHGNHHTVFNSPDPSKRRPLGYFITRLMTKSDGRNLRPKEVIKSAIDDALEAVFSSQTLPTSVFEAVMEAAGAQDDTEIKLPSGLGVRCGDIKSKYADLWKLWLGKAGLNVGFRMILGDVDQLEWFAERIAEKERHRVIVFGHTHDEMLDKDTVLVHDHIYANCGSWNSRKEQHIVEVDKSATKLGVRLCAWNGATKTLDEVDKASL